MLWMLMLDFALSMGLWFGLDRPVCDLPAHCAASACECPKDTPCKKGCTKDDCCCKRATSCEATACCPATCCPVPCYPTAGTTQACCPQACCPPACPPAAYAPQSCQVQAPIAVQGFALPNPVPAPRFYLIEMKLDDETTKMMTPLGHSSLVEVKSPATGQKQRVGVHLHPAGNGCVKVEMRLDEMKSARVGSIHSAFRGTKEVRLDTVSNVVLSGTDPEPRNVQVMVKPVFDAPQQQVMPAPLACPTPPAPPRAAFMPAPLPILPPQVCLPEPLPMPRPMMPAVTPTMMPVAYTPASRPVVSGTRVELVRCCHESKLCLKSGDTSATFMKMTIERRECGALTLSAGQKYAHIKGKQWKAQADCIDIRNDGCVILSGHVKLDSEALGQGASVKADKLCVQVRDGKLIKIINQDTFAPER